MRLLATIGLLGTFAAITTLQAQSLAEHAAAAAGATIGTAAGKPLSNAMTKIFGQVDEQGKTASKRGAKKTESVVRPSTPAESTSPAGQSAPSTGGPEAFSPSPTGGGGAAATTDESAEAAPAVRSRRSGRRAARQRESAVVLEQLPPAQIAPPVPAEPVVKEPTPEEVAGIQVGSTEKDVIAALGAPASHVTIPDDDGHLRETYQYWAKGSQIGTVRLDNGYVVKVEARRF